MPGLDTKEFALQAMAVGHKVRHTFFSDEEWMMAGTVLDIEFEDGCQCSYIDFFATRQDPAWETGWSVISGDFKSPWNPSRKATKRVKDPLPAPEACPHCFIMETGEAYPHISIVNNEEIYGHSYGEWPWAYQCQQCEAYVGLHPFTNIPLGTLADGPTRKARKESKKLFNALHENGRLTRSEAYQRLADKMDIPVSECHFGWFDTEQCKQAAECTRQLFLEGQ